MTIASMKQTLAPWAAAIFCAVLSLICVLSNLLGLMFAGPSDAGNWVIPFLCFLPMCFFYAGAGMSQMQAELRELKKQVSELQGNRST